MEGSGPEAGRRNSRRAIDTGRGNPVTKPKPVSGLGGLVWGIPDPNAPDTSTIPKPAWWASPKILGGIAGAMVIALSIAFI